jgi:hypothetical protein
MARLRITSGVIIALFSISAAFAANTNPCFLSKTEVKRQPCKTSQKLVPERLIKVKPLNEVKATERPSQQNNAVKAPSADTFEAIIAPFIKAVSPHFYDQIIRKDPRPATAQT